MSTTGMGPLRLGVAGLGRRWSQLYRPAFDRRPDRFRIVAVQDDVLRRAETESDRYRAIACAGLRELAGRPEVDVLVWTGGGWAGAMPLRLLAEAGKPCLVTGPWRASLGELARPHSAWEFGQAVLAIPPRFSARSFRLRELFATTLGPPTRMTGRVAVSPIDESAEGDPVRARSGALDDACCELIDWCRFLFRADPVEAGTNTERTELTLAFPGGARASFDLLDRATSSTYLPWWKDATVSITTERGRVESSGEHSIWRDDGHGLVEDHLSHESSAIDTLVEHFHRYLQGSQSLVPTDFESLAHSLASVTTLDDA